MAAFKRPFVPYRVLSQDHFKRERAVLWVYIYAYQIKKIVYLSLQPVPSRSSFFAQEICLNACCWLYLNSRIEPWITVLLMVRVCCCLGACQKETCSEMLIDQ